MPFVWLLCSVSSAMALLVIAASAIEAAMIRDCHRHTALVKQIRQLHGALSSDPHNLNLKRQLCKAMTCLNDKNAFDRAHDGF